MSSGSRRAVFLDRDGILCQSIVRDGRPYPPASWEQFALIDGARERCLRLRQTGFALICVTNQPDIARGQANVGLMEAMNEHLRRELGLDEVRVCAHDEKDGCHCRKPKPGMLLDAARARDVDLGRSYMVGDRWRDIGAGRAAGCRTVFVDYAYDERRPEHPDFTARSVGDALAWIESDAACQTI